MNIKFKAIFKAHLYSGETLFIGGKMYDKIVLIWEKYGYDNNIKLRFIGYYDQNKTQSKEFGFEDIKRVSLDY